MYDRILTYQVSIFINIIIPVPESAHPHYLNLIPTSSSQNIPLFQSVYSPYQPISISVSWISFLVFPLTQISLSFVSGWSNHIGPISTPQNFISSRCSSLIVNPWIPSPQWSQTPYRTDFLTKPSSLCVEEWIIIGIASVTISMTWRGHCLHGWQQRINCPPDKPVPVLKPGCHQGSDENKRFLCPWRRELPTCQAPVCCGQPCSPSILVRKACVFAFTNSH